MDSKAENISRLRRLIGDQEDLLEMLGIPRLNDPNEAQPVGIQQEEKEKDAAAANSSKTNGHCVNERLEVKCGEENKAQGGASFWDEKVNGMDKVGDKVVDEKTGKESSPNPYIMQFPNSVIADEVFLLKTSGKEFPTDVSMEEMKDELLHDKTTTFGLMQEILEEISDEMKYKAEAFSHFEVVKLDDEDPREEVSMMQYVHMQIHLEFPDDIFSD